MSFFLIFNEEKIKFILFFQFSSKKEFVKSLKFGSSCKSVRQLVGWKCREIWISQIIFKKWRKKTQKSKKKVKILQK